jgi:glutamate/tyrosine decarboxylase-like PLP-dependent enzyme
MSDPFKPYQNRFQSHTALPETGLAPERVLAELTEMAEEEDRRWQSGKVSGTFYHAGRRHRDVLNQAFARFSHVNSIQFDLCPSMFKMESEIIAMTAHMLNADAARHPADRVCGTMTSGGSESIMMAMKVYRDRARIERGVQRPEVLIPHTAHPAFDKAGQYFGIDMVHVPVHPPDYRVDPADAAARITPNTVALVGSAGNYPYGLIDPIDRLSDLALEHQLGLHVDGCLGGFILPWIEALGYPVPVFDFRLPGVTSISADTHKFGYALKGTSVVLYRNPALRRYQYFTVPDWPGGMYASPTGAGSRSGGLTAAAWAAMVTLGRQGYLDAARDVMTLADGFKGAVSGIPELRIIGDPTFIISFESDRIDVYHLNDFMKTRGWRFNVLQLPPALHFCLTRPQTRVPGLVDQWRRDLIDGVAYAKTKTDAPAETAALYGLAGRPDGDQAVTELMVGLFDHLFEV